MTSGHIFYRRMGHRHPEIVRGEGVTLWDGDGRCYLDASGGAAVVNIGHGVVEVAHAIAEQAAAASYVHGTMFTTPVLEAYGQRLAPYVPLADPQFYPLTSGSEVVEAAIKFARQLQVARGEHAREVVISRWGSYHGATLGALAVTGRPRMRHFFAPLYRDQPHIPPPFCYHCPFGVSASGCSLACARALETEILHQGPGRVAAFIAEPVSGATLGAVVPPPGYWPLVREICDRYGVLLIVDEVMTGFGRTGRWFGIEHFAVQPDVLVMGKGAAGGVVPFSLLAVRAEDAETIRLAHGDFVHGGTFSHHAVGAAAALATLQYLESQNLVAAAEVRGAYLGQRLRERLASYPCVGDLRGLGLLWGVEFVADRAARVPFPPEWNVGRRVCDRALELGLILYPGHGGIDAVRGDHLLLAPPLVVTEAEIDRIVDLLGQSIGQSCSELEQL